LRIILCEGGLTDRYVLHRAFPSQTMPVDAEVFVYTGPGGEGVPHDVVRVLVDPSVTSIPYVAFMGRNKLTEVELSEGLVEIGSGSFRCCDHSITKINIPISLRRIKDRAFAGSFRTPIRLHDGIESIGMSAFAHCIFTNFRVPPLITVIPDYMLYNCRSMFSLELPYSATEIGNRAFKCCFCLRNVALPPDADLDVLFIDYDNEIISDLQELFGIYNTTIIFALQHRFLHLPIHRLVYYQSYNENVLQKLIAAINMRSSQRRASRSKLDPTGNQKDCLGMTPLHILACSSVHDIEVYRVIIDNYPANLITEDRWGALPLLYAFWGAAPAEIIQFLIESYQLHYPDHVFNWTMMVKTMGRCDTPKENIENMLQVKQMHFPEQPLDWGFMHDNFVYNSFHLSFSTTFRERMKFQITTI
jgi:hypothetical protein